MILNKSNHPVEIKKIDLIVWSLRDEIEAAVAERLAETPEGEEPNLDDIKALYSKQPKFMTQNLESDSLDDDDDEDNEIKAAPDAEETDEDSDDEDKEDSEETEEVKASEGEDSEGEDSEAKDKEDSNDDAVASEVENIANEMLAEQGVDTEEASAVAGYARPVVAADKKAAGFTILADVNMFYILFFSDTPYLQGQTICLKFNIPNSFTLTAEVVNTKHLARNSRVISETRPSYRIQTRISYQFDNERSALRDFLTSIEPTVPPTAKSMKRVEDDKEDDDFEDLGF